MSTSTPTNVPTITPRPASNAEPVWSEGYYFPRFPTPQQIFVIRVATGLENWWKNPNRPGWRVNQSNDVMAALTLVSMQGIINRSDPAVYLDWQDSGMLGNAANFWLTPLASYVDITPVDVTGLDAVEFLWQRFYPRFQGAVIYAPDVPDTINVATMLAGLEDRLMLAPEQLELPVIKDILENLDGTCASDTNTLNLPILTGHPCVIDLRLLADQQGWSEPAHNRDTLRTDRQAIYLWVYENLWPRLEKRAIGVISPGAPSSYWFSDPKMYDPLGLAWRDYLIALRLPALWLSTVEEPDVSLLSQFLDEAPSPIPFLSFYDALEVESVELASRHGDWVPVISNSNTPISTGNLTVLSAIDAPVQPFRPRLDDDRLFAALGNQPLVTLWNSDGDSIQFLLDRGFHGGVDFYWEGVRGSLFGWSTNPTLANLSPLAWNYYVETAGNTSFVAGLSGAGYIYPALMSNSQLNMYLEQSARYLDLTGLRTVFIDERFGAFDERLGTAYYKHLSPVGYLGAFTFFNGIPGAGNYSFPGAPAPLVSPAYVLRDGSGESILQSLLNTKPGTFTLDFPESFSYGEAVSDASAIGGQAVRFSRQDLANCCMVVGSTRMTLAPGNYMITYRLKVEDNQSQLPIAHLMLLQQGVQGRVLTERNLSPVDFTQAGNWQEFTLSLTLADFNSEVQLWLDYMGGTPGNADTVLYADRISLNQQVGSTMPIALPIFIGLVGPINPLNEDLRLVTEEFTRRGGLLLTPDELMAALNPEFLIRWAASMLGSDHPALRQAQNYLDQGQYFQSLLTVREVLQAFPESTYMSTEGKVSIQANAWITDLQLDSQHDNLSFCVHSSPTTEVHLTLQLPNDLFGETVTVTSDGEPVTARISINDGTMIVEFNLKGGSLSVRVIKPN
ncbi:MAG: hypothetical protein JXA42_21740 [Anaerolineales bacterium]|nr:hypothetical protein [Anaerolineales bacterium]